MRNVLVLLSTTTSDVQDYIEQYDGSTYSVSGVLLQVDQRSDKNFPFPCCVLDSENHDGRMSLSYPRIQYSDVLQKIFEADSVISYS